MKKPDYIMAVSALTNEGFGWNEKESTLVWPDTNVGDAPTKEEIDVKLASMISDWDAQEYARNRASAFPSIGDQLDMQYHDQLDGTTTWKDAVAKVKADNPKPKE